jgi:glycosyltransferase involved in cell wall biosynthesis
MRLGISGFFWNRENTGSGQYTRRLAYGLLNLDGGPECLLLRPHYGDGPAIASPRPAHISERFLAPPLPLGENAAKLWFEQVSFPRACLDEGVDVLHVPYFAPPFLGARKTLVTIHDLIPLILPAYRGSLLVRTYTRLVAAAARRAAAIVTDSQASRRDILRLLRVPAERVRVVHLAADKSFRPESSGQRLQEVRQRYGLPEEYVLYIGGFDHRKNLNTLIAAYASLRAELRGRIPLVIAGRLPTRDSDFFPHPRRLVEQQCVQDRVVFVGWVEEKDKPALYSGATLFVFPSLYEGFGLPVLEAMSCGTAVVASNSTSLPEITGDSALLVDPHDTEGLAAAMTLLLEDAAHREELASKGLQRARLFSWDKTVAQTMEAYRSVAADPLLVPNAP